MSVDEEGIRQRALKLIGRAEESEDERLLNLFQNRAELKKAFLDLQVSLRHSQEKLGVQEAATRRAEERLLAIEQLLSRPNTGYTALVYFQLRALWRQCHERLAGLSEELRGRHEDRLRRGELMRFNQEKQRQLSSLDEQIAAARLDAEERRRVRDAAAAELAARKGLLALLARRRLRRSAAQARAALDSARLHLSELQDRRSAVQAAPWPEFAGLEVAHKREINVAVIALAQQLYVHFSRDDLANLAREGATRAVEEIHYGSEEECKDLIGRIQAAQAALGVLPADDPELVARTRVLAGEVRFRSERETVPMASSVSRIALARRRSGESSQPVMLEVNVLADEYWNVYEVFIP